MDDVSIMALLNTKRDLPKPLFNIFLAHAANFSEVPF